MHTDEWEVVKPTDTHILWTQASANFACLCGNYIVVSNAAGHTCKLCGRVYELRATILTRKEREAYNQ